MGNLNLLFRATWLYSPTLTQACQTVLAKAEYPGTPPACHDNQVVRLIWKVKELTLQ